jgi:hypothetical protein
MARTPESVTREAERRAEIPQLQRQARIAHGLRAGSFLVATGAVIDDISNGAITKGLDKGIFNHIDLHIGTGNLNATRLSVAGLYVVAGAVQLTREHRRLNRVSHVELLSAQEVQFDRLATAVELGNGQRTTEGVIPEHGEVTENPS